MTQVHVVGATGYAAVEAIRLLAGHPEVTLGVLESRSGAGERIRDVVPMLARVERELAPSGTALERVAEDDVVFLCGNHELAHEQAAQFLARGARVVDFSDAFRLAANAGDAVYGHPERYAAQIASARLVANPGCYPTSALLALAPLAPFVPRIERVIIDAKSGITGAGRNPRTELMFGEVDEDVRAYGLTGHRHLPEIVQETCAAGVTAPILFSPHVVPLRRGMLSDVYLIAREPIARDEIVAALARAYANSPFVTVFADVRAPYLPAVLMTNDAQLAVAERDGVIQILSAIDNLGKGAAGNAVQCLNLMLGLPEETGLRARTAVHR